MGDPVAFDANTPDDLYCGTKAGTIPGLGDMEDAMTIDLEPIFAADTDWKQNACLDWNDDRMELLVMGYRKAADIVVQGVIDSGRNQDSLVYPVCYLYRHYIELRLKQLIRLGHRLLDEPNDFSHTHEIEKLLSVVEKIVDRVFPEGTCDLGFVMARHVALEFHKYDERSTEFGYSNSESCIAELTHVNVRRLGDFVGKFADCMEAIDTGLSAYNEAKEEMLRDASWEND
jgi:hypothetical protein